MTVAHSTAEPQVSNGDADSNSRLTPMVLLGPQPYQDIILLADILDDLERVRIANENRWRSLTSEEDWGKGIPAIQIDFIAGLIENLKAQEHGAVLALKRAVRKSPLGVWQKANTPYGEKTLGRFLKEVGDPAWHYAKDRPRTLAELRAYCGLHVWPTHGSGGNHRRSGGSGSDTHAPRDTQMDSGVAPHLVRGRQANWSTQAKTRLYLIAEGQMKNRNSKFRPVYDDGRYKYAESTHQVECKRCGPKGKPAQVGSELSKGHQHARAMRLLMKEILADIWRAASKDEVANQTAIDAPAEVPE